MWICSSVFPQTFTAKEYAVWNDKNLAQRRRRHCHEQTDSKPPMTSESCARTRRTKRPTCSGIGPSLCRPVSQIQSGKPLLSLSRVEGSTRSANFALDEGCGELAVDRSPVGFVDKKWMEDLVDSSCYLTENRSSVIFVPKSKYLGPGD